MKETLYPNPEAIADRLTVSQKTVKRWIKDEGLPAFQESSTGPHMCLESQLIVWMLDFAKRMKKKRKSRKNARSKKACQ